VPEDRTRFEHTIELAGRALQAVAQAKEAVQWVKTLMEEVDADMVHRRIFHSVRLSWNHEPGVISMDLRSRWATFPFDGL
jgi:hypothetical protein